MRILCDTHTLAWWLLDDRRLSQTMRALIIEPGNQVLVSAVSAFEMATKFRIGKWPDIGNLVGRFEEAVASENFEILPLSPSHAIRGGLLDGAHCDPFDRLLAGQSLVEGIPLVTSDAAFKAWGVETVW
ncbi:MAG: type II toxin-antitoxin system VapC family toxin [Rhizobiales bacterium]|nr:type II toxin-antitoxin system VapC family toxin [Hyphomicrobiales bacterium]MBI3672495.1 type II toxin-antitoxin system VapC family toxin [Hyphomicrobiales bacterium]